MRLNRQIVLQAGLIVGSLIVVAIGARQVLESRAAATPLLGPDTSNHQAILDSAKAKTQGMSYHFMKVTQGRTFNDIRFPQQRPKSVAAGLIVGGYHFLEAGNGAAQCDHYLDRLRANGGVDNIMLVLDVELQNSTTGPSYKDVTDFLARCQPQTPGRTWVIYTGGWYWGNAKQRGYLGNPKAPPGTVLWISLYVGGSGTFQALLEKVAPQGSSDDPYAAAPINGWPDYAFRQYSESATLANLTVIDANVTYKGLDFVKQLAGIPTATGKPDLVVTDVSWAPATPANGNEIIYSATIKNQGTVATPTGRNIGVSFLVDGKQVSWAADGNTPLAAGASRTQIATGGPNDDSRSWPARTGSYSVQAYVDDLDLISEADETNNFLVKPLEVLPGLILGDIDGDGRVNALDLSVLITHDGENYPAADFNKDGTVGAADLAIMLSRWTW